MFLLLKVVYIIKHEKNNWKISKYTFNTEKINHTKYIRETLKTFDAWY